MAVVVTVGIDFMDVEVELCGGWMGLGVTD